MADNVSVPSDQPPARNRAQRRQQAARDAVRALVRDYYQQHFGAAPPGHKSFVINLALRFSPDKAWAVEFHPPFEEQISGQLEELEAARGVFERGRVFCFRCATTRCEHARPPGPLDVFRGYSSTGVPEWYELAQALMEAKHEQIDLLYAEPPRVLATLQYGHTLKLRQLTTFGRASKTYSILAQVVAGYFLAPSAPGHPRDDRRFAVSFQAVECRGPSGELQLCLNPITARLTAAEWDELLASDWQAYIERAYNGAATAIENLERQAREARRNADPRRLRDLLRRVPAILARLGRELEQGARQGIRRTHHADSHRRHIRPVHKALEDALQAPLERWFYDEKKATWVVCGKQRRVHVFNADARHVTSLMLPPASVEFRLRTRRWRRMQAEELAAFKELLQRAVSGL